MTKPEPPAIAVHRDLPLFREAVGQGPHNSLKYSAVIRGRWRSCARLHVP